MQRRRKVVAAAEFAANRHEPVGYRYLSRMVTTLYFKLSMLFAVPIFFLGVAVLSILRSSEYECLILGSSVSLIAIAIVYFKWQAKCTHRVLCETRHELNRRITR